MTIRWNVQYQPFTKPSWVEQEGSLHFHFIYQKNHFHFPCKLWLTIGLKVQCQPFTGPSWVGWEGSRLITFTFNYQKRSLSLSLNIMVDNRLKGSMSAFHWAELSGAGGQSSHHFDAWLPICPSIGRPLDIQSTAGRSIENEMAKMNFEHTINTLYRLKRTIIWIYRVYSVYAWQFFWSIVSL